MIFFILHVKWLDSFLIEFMFFFFLPVFVIYLLFIYFVTLDPRHGTLALDMEPSTLEEKIDSAVDGITGSLLTGHFVNRKL